MILRTSVFRWAKAHLRCHYQVFVGLWPFEFGNFWRNLSQEGTQRTHLRHVGHQKGRDSENPKNHPWNLKSLAVFWRSWDHPTKSTGGSHDENSTRVHLWIDNIKFGIDVRGGLLFVLFLQLSCRCWGQFRPVVSKRPLDPKIHVRRCVRVRNGDEIRNKYSMNYQNPYQKKHTHTARFGWKLKADDFQISSWNQFMFIFLEGHTVIPKQPSLSHLVTSLDDFDLFQIFCPKQLGSH